MFSVAIIKPNNYTYVGDEFLLSKIMETISEHIIFKEISSVDLMDEICETIGLTDDSNMGDTIIIYEDLYKVVQLCYLDTEGTELNMLASFYARKKIYGSVLILNSSIDQITYTCSNQSIDLDMLSNILYKKVVHKGICCFDDITEYNYYNNPLVNVENCEYMVINFNMFNFYFSAYYKKNQSDPINKKASRFVGKLLYGPVLIVSKSSETEFIDLDKNLFLELLKKCGGDLERRVVNNPEYKNNELQKIMNGYCVLNQTCIYKECATCNNKDNLILCTGCYRTYYDSVECQKKDWERHSKDCSYKK